MQLPRFLANMHLRPTVRLAAIVLISMAGWAQPSPAQIVPENDLPARMGDLPMQGTQRSGGSDGGASGGGNASGPVQLRDQATTESNRNTPGNGGAIPDASAIVRVEPRPQPLSEFERYVNTIAADTARSDDSPIRRFGSKLLTDIGTTSATLDPLPAVPDDYVVKPGDEIALSIWGSVDANLRLVVDRAGQISVPRIGAIPVAGLLYGDLGPALKRRVGQTFKGFELSATMGRLRAVRIFVTGFAQTPGSITVSSLSSVLQAVMRAGGPSAAGSFRDIRLTRHGKLVASYDLYDMLLKGDRRADELVQPDDIIFVGPVGTEVAVMGSVNQRAIYELRPGETLSDALRMSGGFTAVADNRHVTLERLADRNTGHVADLALPDHGRDVLRTGDVVTAYSVVAAALPKIRQNQRVHVDGEVVSPGDYLLAPGSTFADALRAAGGMTAAAYPFGTEFTRRAVRITQQANYDRALRELESNMAKSDATQRVTTTEESAARAASTASNARLLERLRQLKPTGRVVLEINPDDRQLPDLALEDGDSIRIPSRDTSVGVFGSVFNSGSFLFSPHRTTSQYLHLAGGPTVGADKRSMFVIHANGAVVSAQQGASFWHSGNDFSDAEVLPGDTIFVPEELNKSTFIQDAKDWTQILYQFGLGLAGIKALGL